MRLDEGREATLSVPTNPQDGGAPWATEPLVAVGHKVVSIQLLQVHEQLAKRMRPINKHLHICLSAEQLWLLEYHHCRVGLRIMGTSSCVLPPVLMKYLYVHIGMSIYPPQTFLEALT